MRSTTFIRTGYTPFRSIFFHGDPAAASDVTQQVFLKSNDFDSAVSGDAEFSTWLYRLVVNACMDAARSRKSDPVISDQLRMETFAAPGSQEEDYARSTDGELGSGGRVGSAAEIPNRRSTAVFRGSFL